MGVVCPLVGQSPPIFLPLNRIPFPMSRRSVVSERTRGDRTQKQGRRAHVVSTVGCFDDRLHTDALLPFVCRSDQSATRRRNSLRPGPRSEHSSGPHSADQQCGSGSLNTEPGGFQLPPQGHPLTSVDLRRSARKSPTVGKADSTGKFGARKGQ